MSELTIGIIGASAGGLYTALFLTRTQPNARIILFDRMDKPGKKLLATGNGHCNLLHDPMRADAFDHPRFIAPFLARYDADDMLKELSRFGIFCHLEGELLYPLSFSAGSYVRHLISLLENRHCEFVLSTSVLDVNGTTIVTDKGDYVCDHVVFAFGGKSQENLGSNGSMFSVLEKRGYKIAPLRPGLCPLRSPDVPKSLFGVRHAARIALLRNEKELYAERGEIQFKKDGLSGIAVMNASNLYQVGDVIAVDLFPGLSDGTLKEWLFQSQNRCPNDFLCGYLVPELQDFVCKKAGISRNQRCNPEQLLHLSRTMKGLRFTLSGNYGFDASQVTLGGVITNQVDPNLRGKKNPCHHFVGECIDVAGFCGGYNLGWALISAFVVANNL